MAWTEHDDRQVEHLRRLSQRIRDDEHDMRDILRDLVSRHGLALSEPAWQFERQAEADLIRVEHDLDDLDRHWDRFLRLLRDAAVLVKETLGRAA